MADPVTEAIRMMASHLRRPRHMPTVPFDESSTTQVVLDAYRSLLKRHPKWALLPLKEIRVNPAMREAGLNGQYVGDGVLEINPDVTDPDQLERLLLHELRHASGGNEAEAAREEFNVPVASHGKPRPYVSAGAIPPKGTR